MLNANVNFSEDISPIIYENCTECHRGGEIGAFLPLTNYDEIFDNQDLIEYVITTEDNFRHGNAIMPPWPPNREYSTLVGERALTEDEIQLFSDWIADGAEQGDPELEHPIPETTRNSSLGMPKSGKIFCT